MTGPTVGRLAGKTALVTGSGAGIGESFARRFAREGAFVAVHDRRLEDAEIVARSIRSDGYNAVAIAGDLADPDVPELIARTAVEALGRVDILVNNAAVKTRSRLEATDAAMFDAIIAVNLRAPLLLIRALLGHFTAVGGGCVLNIGSVNGYGGDATLLAYSISKGGLTVLTRNVSDAFATRGLRVNQLNLGWVMTPSEDEILRAEGFSEGWEERLPSNYAPTGSLLLPDEIAHFALAFVENGANRVSGSIVDLEQYPMIGRNPTKGTES